MVAGGKQLLLLHVPDGKGEHAAQMLDAVSSVLFVQVDNGFRVAVSTVMMTTGLELLAECAVVIDLPVENDPQSSILVTDGLVAGREVDNAEAAHAQAYAAAGVDSLIVGPAMHHRGTHSPQDAGIHLFVLRELHDAGNSTHWYLRSASLPDLASTYSPMPAGGGRRHALRRSLALPFPVNKLPRLGSLQPTQKTLLPSVHLLRFVSQLQNQLIARFCEPGNPMRGAAIFLLVGSFAAPIVDPNSAALPVAHRIPLNRFVRPQDLAGAETGVTPEFGDLVKAGENSSANASSFRVACPDQQNPTCRFHVFDQRTHAINSIGRYQTLFGKHIAQLGIVLVGEIRVVSFFDDNSTLLRFANTAAAGTVHACKQLFF